MSEHVKNGKRHIVAYLDTCASQTQFSAMFSTETRLASAPAHVTLELIGIHDTFRPISTHFRLKRNGGDPTPVNTNCTPSRYHQLISPSNNYDTNLPVPQMISLSLLAVSQWISPSHNSPSSTVDLPSYQFHTSTRNDSK